MTRLPALITAAIPLLVVTVWLGDAQDVQPRSGEVAEITLAQAEAAVDQSAHYQTVMLEPAPPEGEFLSLQPAEEPVDGGWKFISGSLSSGSVAAQRLTTRMRPVMDVSNGAHTLKAAVYQFSHTDASASQQEVKRYSF